jgi:hypothetical protein
MVGATVFVHTIIRMMVHSHYQIRKCGDVSCLWVPRISSLDSQLGHMHVTAWAPLPKIINRHLAE